MASQFYTSEVKALKIKAKKFWELIHTFLEFKGGKLVEGLFAPPPTHPIHPEYG